MGAHPCAFRKIRATEFLTEDNNLWNNRGKDVDFKKISRHGQEWHKKMMDIIYRYFKATKHNVVMEPQLNQGRADLGIRQKSNPIICVEVGTVSLFKLWYNLSTMKNAVFFIIPSESRIIELAT